MGSTLRIVLAVLVVLALLVLLREFLVARRRNRDDVLAQLDALSRVIKPQRPTRPRAEPWPRDAGGANPARRDPIDRGHPVDGPGTGLPGFDDSGFDDPGSHDPEFGDPGPDGGRLDH